MIKSGINNDKSYKQLSAPIAVVRSVLLFLLLYGSLLPKGEIVRAIAAVATAPIVAIELVRCLPRPHPAISGMAALFMTFGVVGILNAPASAYGRDKFTDIMILTLSRLFQLA